MSSITLDVSPTHHNNIPIAQNEPLFDESGWRVSIPGGNIFNSFTGMQYWSNSMSQSFTLQREIMAGAWSIEWNENNSIQHTHVAFDDEELPAEFYDYEYNEPFEYQNRWYVVMETNDNFEYLRGQAFFAERESCGYRLDRNVRYDLFGSYNAFRIVWEEENQSFDEFSEEREEIDTRNIAPVLSTNIGRDIPLVSIEQEFSGNGDLVARTLFGAGLAYSQYVDGYHMSEARHEMDHSDRICYVETDSSCGYELIFSKINLKDRTEAVKVSEAQTILKRLKDENSIRLSARCGFHIHVDVSNWGMKEIVSAYHLWNYMEDTVFRFASAFWNSHRDEEVGGGYSTPVPKGYIGRVGVANAVMERRDALNFSHILRAKSNCRCGASIYEDWANCTCRLSQPTLEFRVFNATLNQRKIKAYAAFCIAFVNAAKENDYSPDAFKEMRWAGTNFYNLSGIDEWKEQTKERLEYILREFSLTNSEKSDIAYCFRNSSLEPVLELL